MRVKVAALLGNGSTKEGEGDMGGVRVCAELCKYQVFFFPSPLSKRKGYKKEGEKKKGENIKKKKGRPLTKRHPRAVDEVRNSVVW